PPTADITTLSLHDALPISIRSDRYPTDAVPAVSATPWRRRGRRLLRCLVTTLRSGVCRSTWRTSRDCPELTSDGDGGRVRSRRRDRKSTRLNSSHVKISYA